MSDRRTKMSGTFLNNACVGHEVVRHRDVPNKRVANDRECWVKNGVYRAAAIDLPGARIVKERAFSPWHVHRSPKDVGSNNVQVNGKSPFLHRNYNNGERT